MKRWLLFALGVATMIGCTPHVKMPVYRSLVADQAPNQFSYILEEVVVRGTLYDQDVVILSGDTETKMRPSATEWLRDAIVTDCGRTGGAQHPMESQGSKLSSSSSLPNRSTASFSWQTSPAKSHAILRVTVTSSDGAVAYDRRFVGHLEDLDQMLYVYPFFFSELNDLGDMLTQSAQKALVDAASRPAASLKLEKYGSALLLVSSLALSARLLALCFSLAVVRSDT